MAYRVTCQEAVNSRLLFFTVYAIVIIGVLVSAFYVVFARSSCDALASFSTSPLPGSLPLSPSNASKSSKLQSHGAKLAWKAPSPNSKMPPLETFRLRKELVESRVKDNVIIVTFGNFAFLEFILNWVKHMTNLGISNLLVGALDTRLLEALYWKGIPVFDMGSHMSSKDLGWGSPKFYKLGREKVFLINSLLPFGYELLMCDSDAIWLQNPLPYLARFPEADVLTSTDQVTPTSVDDRLDAWQYESTLNTTLESSIGGRRNLPRSWQEILMANDSLWDQVAFNHLLERQLGPSVDDESGLAYAYDGILKFGLLPASIFCNGHTYFIQAMYQQLRLKPYAVHATFQYAGTEGKRHRMREAMLYYDHPEYYNSEGGFMTFKPFIPKSLLMDGNHTIESHFKLINHQLKQIRTALAIASLLKRTLVMPPIWCRFDRLWYSHPGKLKGSMTPQPFLCPLDHVFEIGEMVKKLPEEEYGPRIDFREYSFLDNPSLPQEVKGSWLDVHLCQGCEASNSSSMPGSLTLPKHSNEETLKTVFSKYKDVKVIRFSSMQGAFSGFASKAREQKFRNRVNQYTSLWCCEPDRKPGYIYYDMYWDEKPVPPKTYS